MPDLLADIYNAFDPFEPLPADSHEYVDCQEVRGEANVLVDLGRRYCVLIELSVNSMLDIEAQGSQQSYCA
jgi:hypothetical protein